MTEMYVHPNDGEASDGATGQASAVATATMEKVADEAVDLREKAGQEVGSVADTAKDQVRTLADEARTRVKGEADNATMRAAAALSGTAEELSTMAAGVSDPGPATRLVSSASSRVDDVAQRLRSEGYEGIARDVSNWARKNPGLFLAAAAGAGFVIGRVFRSVDAKGVAEAARGSSPALGSGSPQSDQGGDDLAQDTVAGIGTMSPPAQAPPAYAPQPHPDATAPVTDLGMGATPPYPVPDAGTPGVQP